MQMDGENIYNHLQLLAPKGQIVHNSSSESTCVHEGNQHDVRCQNMMNEDQRGCPNFWAVAGLFGIKDTKTVVIKHPKGREHEQSYSQDESTSARSLRIGENSTNDVCWKETWVHPWAKEKRVKIRIIKNSHVSSSMSVLRTPNQAVTPLYHPQSMVGASLLTIHKTVRITMRRNWVDLKRKRDKRRSRDTRAMEMKSVDWQIESKSIGPLRPSDTLVWMIWLIFGTECTSKKEHRCSPLANDSAY